MSKSAAYILEEIIIEEVSEAKESILESYKKLNDICDKVILKNIKKKNNQCQMKKINLE